MGKKKDKPLDPLERVAFKIKNPGKLPPENKETEKQ
jgi:hypothetical protein